MKRISLSFVAAALLVPALANAQDAAVEQRLNRLSAEIQDLRDARDAQTRRLEDLARQVRDLQEQLTRPSGNYASPEDVKQLAAKIQEVDRKRQEDNDLIIKEIKGLGRTLSAPAPKKPAVDEGGAAPIPDRGYEYTVQQGDTLTAIVQAYRDKNIKVTVEQILKANPGLKPESMKVGQKIFVPMPQP